MDTTTARSNVILLATDFSPIAGAALVEAAAIARQRGAKLLILHVQGPSVAYAQSGPCYGVPELESSVLNQMLHSIVPPGNGIVCEHMLVLGDAATEIVRIAGKENVDMIVMGTEGRGGLSRMLMGSVAEAVVRTAPCPVLTYRGRRYPRAPEEQSLPLAPMRSQIETCQ